MLPEPLPAKHAGGIVLGEFIYMQSAAMWGYDRLRCLATIGVAKEVGDRAGEGAVYRNLGNAYDSQGDFSKAIEYHAQHLALAKEVGDRAGQGTQGVLQPQRLPRALERVRQSRRLPQSTTCDGNIAEACTHAVLRSNVLGYRPHT